MGGTIASVFLISGASMAFAQTADVSPTNVAAHSWHMKHEGTKGLRLGKLAGKLGLDVTQVQEELKNGKTMKDIFQEHGITKDQLKGSFGDHVPGKHLPRRMTPPADMLDISSSILGITPDQLKAEFKEHKPLLDIVQAHGLTMEQFKQKSIESMKARIQSGQATAKQTDRYNHIIEKLTNGPLDSARGKPKAN